MLFFRLFQHLLPRGAAWRTTIEKRLRQFFLGLSDWPQDFRDFVDAILLDVFPSTTRQLSSWESHFGIPAGTSDEARRAALTAEGQLQEGQGLDSLQAILTAAGFACKVYGPYISGPPWVVRDPRAYTTIPKSGTATCGNPDSTCGSAASCNTFLTNDPKYIVFKDYTNRAPPLIPSDPNTWPFFIYLAGATIDTPFVCHGSRRAELERLIQKIRPLENWVVINGDFTTGGYPVTDLDGFLSIDGSGFLELTD